MIISFSIDNTIKTNENDGSFIFHKIEDHKEIIKFLLASLWRIFQNKKSILLESIELFRIKFQKKVNYVIEHQIRGNEDEFHIT